MITPIISAYPIKNPSADLKPNGINPKAVKIWEAVFDKYKSKILSYDNEFERWAAAIILFEKVCAKKRVKPFVNVDNTKETKKLSREEKTNKKDKVDTITLASSIKPSFYLIDKFKKKLADLKVLSENNAFKFGYNGFQDREGKSYKIAIFRTEVKIKKDHTALELISFIGKKLNFKKYDLKSFIKKTGQSSVVLSYSNKSSKIIVTDIYLKIPNKIWNEIKSIDDNKFFKFWIKNEFKA